MKFNSEQIKAELFLAVAIMTMLFTICLVKYTAIFKKEEKATTNTQLELSGGNDLFSKELQTLIPYSEVTNAKYKTAYQNELSTILTVDNKVLLAMAMNYNEKKTVHRKMEVIGAIEKMYGDTFFLVNESFGINGVDICLYDSYKEEYACSSKNYNGIVYKAIRNRKSINILDDKAYLEEEIFFLSEEVVGNVTYYKIYC